MKKPKFKLGDRVKCINNNQKFFNCPCKGDAWIEGKIFTISHILKDSGYNYYSTSDNIYCGVYEPYLELFSRNKRKMTEKNQKEVKGNDKI